MTVEDGEESARKELGYENKALCVLQWQRDCYKSVVRIRLVKDKNPSACVTVKY
jgi:hypothetical protein